MCLYFLDDDGWITFSFEQKGDHGADDTAANDKNGRHGHCRISERIW